MRKRFCAAVVLCLAGTMCQAQRMSPVMRPVTLHASSSAAEWLRETVRRIDNSRLSFEAHELHAHISRLADMQNTDNGHPIRLQVKQGVPTAAEPKWPSVPRMAIPKVGETEIRPGAWQKQKSEVESQMRRVH